MASPKVVTLDQFKKVLGDFNAAHIEDLKKASVLGIAKSIPMLVERSPVDTGLYAQSWGFSKTEYGAIIGNYAPHSPIIEDGARPFKPPIAPLLAWAKRVLKDSSQPPDYSPEVWRLAIGTQKKIAEQGMKPKKIMANAIEEIIQNIQVEYEKLGNK